MVLVCLNAVLHIFWFLWLWQLFIRSPKMHPLCFIFSTSILCVCLIQHFFFNFCCVFLFLFLLCCFQFSLRFVSFCSIFLFPSVFLSCCAFNLSETVLLQYVWINIGQKKCQFSPQSGRRFQPYWSGWEIGRTDRRHQIIKGITVVSRHNPILNPFFFFLHSAMYICKTAPRRRTRHTVCIYNIKRPERLVAPKGEVRL